VSFPIIVAHLFTPIRFRGGAVFAADVRLENPVDAFDFVNDRVLMRAEASRLRAGDSVGGHLKFVRIDAPNEATASLKS